MYALCAAARCVGFYRDDERLGADVFAMLHAMQRVGRQPLLENQLILRDALAEQRLVKGFVRNHFFTSLQV